MESGSTPPEGNGGRSPDDRIPRGAIAVVVVGVIACVAAALLTGGSKSGEAAHLEWKQHKPIPDSKAVAIPGSKTAKMRLVDGGIRETGTNVAGYSLFRILATAEIDKGAPIGKGKLTCRVHATRGGTLIAQSYGGLRALYPRSSEEGIYGQEVPETVTMKFASHGYEYAVVEVGDVGTATGRFTNVEGVKLDWPEYEEGTEHLEYHLPEGTTPHKVELPFYTIWKSTKPPAATVSCTLETGNGKATAHTEGQLDKLSLPINEEEESAESEAAEEELEEAEAEGGGE